MEQSGIYRVNAESKSLEVLNETDLATHGFKERYDLQEWIAAHPEVLGEDLLIIGKEFNLFDLTNERVDLVALDSAGNLVVIELKRDDSGADVHWQAIKYASYFARAKGESIVEMYAKYSGVSYEEAEQHILVFTELAKIESLNHKQRIILACHRFAREVTNAVIWLLESYGVDITCIQLTPFADPATQSFYLQSRTIIPVPGTDFAINLGSPSRAAVSVPSSESKDDEISAYMASIVNVAEEQLDANLRPDKHSRWAGNWGKIRYYKAWYSHNPWSNHAFSYQTHLYGESGKRLYDIRFNVEIAAALSRGLTEADIAVISSSMKEYAPRNGFGFNETATSLTVTRAFPAPDLDDNLRDQVANKLVELINYFTPIVEGLSEAKNEQ